MSSVCVIGCDGMLGFQLSRTLEENGFRVIRFPHSKVDITDRASVFNTLEKTDYLVNCAAITDTTYCETAEGMIKSYGVNVIGVINLSEFCKLNGMHFIHISSDSVYSEYSPTIDRIAFPVNVYACHKLIAEHEAMKIFSNNIEKLSILRCSWLYGNTRGIKKNFVEKVIGFAEKSKDIKIVDDCFGRPTSVEFVSECISECIRNGHYGISDCSIDSKPISRYEFASAILKILSLKFGRFCDVTVTPVKSCYFEGLINQNKLVPNSLVDEYGLFAKSTASVMHRSDYDYWLDKYIDGI